jgi:polysaccharide export outer membrane protein
MRADRWLAAAPLALLCACAHTGPYVWVQDFKGQDPAPTAYAIREGDVIRIQVWNQDAMSTRARVRADGRVSVPFLKDVTVVGKTPADLATELEGLLKDYVKSPAVYVVVEEAKPETISVLGEVGRPGVYPLGDGAGVAHVLASAGGLTAFAHKDRIYVLRSGTRPARIRFAYRDVVDGAGAASAFGLQAGDVVVVE